MVEETQHNIGPEEVWVPVEKDKIHTGVDVKLMRTFKVWKGYPLNKPWEEWGHPQEIWIFPATRMQA